MPTKDLYAVLGVLPDAEDVVIKAAYRALAQRYHPDKWRGDPAEATRRMAELNDVYAVLGDPKRRAEYDREREGEPQDQDQYNDQDSQSEAFTSALSELEDRWQVAVSIFPDLADLRTSLSRISTPLAFSFVVSVLETKAFESRQRLAAHMERMFLERYFGTNEVVLMYARFLILRGQKAAAKALNHVVDVMGSAVDPKLLIGRIDKDFGLDRLRKQEAELAEKAARVASLEHELRFASESSQRARAAFALAREWGFKVTVEAGFLKYRSSVVLPDGSTKLFENEGAFVGWMAERVRAMRAQHEGAGGGQ